MYYGIVLGWCTLSFLLLFCSAYKDTNCREGAERLIGVGEVLIQISLKAYHLRQPKTQTSQPGQKSNQSARPQVKPISRGKFKLANRVRTQTIPPGQKVNQSARPEHRSVIQIKMQISQPGRSLNQ